MTAATTYGPWKSIPLASRAYRQAIDGLTVGDAPGCGARYECHAAYALRIAAFASGCDGATTELHITTPTDCTREFPPAIYAPAVDTIGRIMVFRSLVTRDDPMIAVPYYARALVRVKCLPAGRRELYIQLDEYRQAHPRPHGLRICVVMDAAAVQKTAELLEARIAFGEGRK